MKMKNITDFVFRRQVGSKDVQSYHKSVESLLEFKATTPHANEVSGKKRDRLLLFRIKEFCFLAFLFLMCIRRNLCSLLLNRNDKNRLKLVFNIINISLHSSLFLHCIHN